MCKGSADLHKQIMRWICLCGCSVASKLSVQKEQMESCKDASLEERAAEWKRKGQGRGRNRDAMRERQGRSSRRRERREATKWQQAEGLFVFLGSAGRCFPRFILGVAPDH